MNEADEGALQAGILHEGRLFRTLFITTPDSIVTTTLDGEIVLANDRAVEMFGFDSTAGMRGTSAWDLLAPEDRERALMTLSSRLDRDDIVGRNTEYQLRRREGTTFPAEVSSSVLLDDDGQAHGLVIVARDISVRRKAEDAYRQLFEGAHDLIFSLDLQGNFINANHAAERISGYDAATIRTLNMAQVIAPEYMPVAMKMIAQKIAGVERTAYELEVIATDGRRVLLEVDTQLIYEDGKPVGIQGIGRDITERKRAEEELARLLTETRQAAAERSAILSQIADGVIIAAPDGTIVFANDAAYRIYGTVGLGVALQDYSSAYHIFTLDGQPYPVDDLPLARAIRTGERASQSGMKVRRDDGTEVVIATSAAPVVADDGTKLGAVLSVRDVTAEYALSRQKDEFLSAAAHDLKTPLTTIKGHAQVVLRRLADLPGEEGDKVRGALRRIDAVSTGMTILINELLDLTRIQMGRPLDLVRSTVDLVLLVRRGVAGVRYNSDRLTFEVKSAVPSLEGQWDAYRLERVLGNLLTNAIDYSPAGGIITVSVRAEDDTWAVLEVRDQGLGIPPADLPRVFERFHRAANVAGRIPGTGIGLTAVKQIVEQHGGSITVDSREGQGTTFSVRLPLS